MPLRKQPTMDAVEIIHRRYFEGNPERLAELEEERANAEIARVAYDLREQAGLTLEELAERVGTPPAVLRDLEDADYDGNAYLMLCRIAAALRQRVELRLVPSKEPLRPVL